MREAAIASQVQLAFSSFRLKGTKMKPVLLLAAITLAVMPPAASWAAPQSQPPAVGQPSAKAMALSRRYIELLDMPKMMDTMMVTLMPQMIQQLSQGDASSDATDMVTQATREAMGAVMPKIMDRAATLYAQLFTEDELQALVDFYGGPYGKSIVAKSPRAAPMMAAAMTDLMPDIQAEMLKSLCARMACDAKPPPKKTAT